MVQLIYLRYNKIMGCFKFVLTFKLLKMFNITHLEGNIYIEISELDTIASSDSLNKFVL